MKTDMHILERLTERYPSLSGISGDIYGMFALLRDGFAAGNKLLVAGNGGSRADADHIAGELMKGFTLARPLSEDRISVLESINAKGKDIAEHLQRGLPVIVLDSGGALGTAFVNDIANGADYVFAQQVNALGRAGDVFLGISTSGNSRNVVNAAITAKAYGMRVVALTGSSGGELSAFADVAVKVPTTECYEIQELHLPVYHTVCLMLENEFFGGKR